jgi:hypothetical protein
MGPISSPKACCAAGSGRSRMYVELMMYGSPAEGRSFPVAGSTPGPPNGAKSSKSASSTPRSHTGPGATVGDGDGEGVGDGEAEGVGVVSAGSSPPHAAIEAMRVRAMSSRRMSSSDGARECWRWFSARPALSRWFSARGPGRTRAR